jgi:hypothetical protein
VTDKLLSKEFSAVCGEFYVYSQLLRNNIQSYLAIGKNNPDWDIVSVLEDKTEIKIQVKTMQWKYKTEKRESLSFTITGKWEQAKFDILVIVILNRSGLEYDTLIIESSKIKSKDDNNKNLFDEDSNIYYTNLTITLNTLYNEENSKHYSNHRNRWNKIKEFK